MSQQIAALKVANHPNLDSFQRKPTRLGKWANSKQYHLKLKYRAIFEIEAHPEIRNMPISEKVIKAREVLDEYIEFYKNIGKWDDERDSDLSIEEKDINYFNFRLLRQAPALRGALIVRTLEYFDLLYFQNDMIEMHKRALERLEEGKIESTVKFWREVDKAKRNLEHHLRLDNSDKLRREVAAIKKAYNRAIEELSWYQSNFAKEAAKLGKGNGKDSEEDDQVVSVEFTETQKGVKEVENLVGEEENADS